MRWSFSLAFWICFICLNVVNAECFPTYCEVCLCCCLLCSFIWRKICALDGEKQSLAVFKRKHGTRVYTNKLPAEPNKIKCLLMETEAHDVGWNLITRKRGKALVVTAFGAQRYSPGPRAALPYTSHLPHLKALTFKVAHHFPEDWEHEKGPPCFLFSNKEDKRSMSDYVISESQWAVTNMSTLLFSVDVVRSSSWHTLWADVLRVVIGTAIRFSCSHYTWCQNAARRFNENKWRNNSPSSQVSLWFPWNVVLLPPSLTGRQELLNHDLEPQFELPGTSCQR